MTVAKVQYIGICMHACAEAYCCRDRGQLHLLFLLMLMFHLVLVPVIG